MAYKHGVYGYEHTSIVPPARASASVPVVIGVAPINQSQREKAPVNEPVLCYTYSEAVQAFGFSVDFKNYDISEFISSHFALFNVAPVVFINVLDPEKHKITGNTVTLSVNDNEAVLQETGVIKSTVKVKDETGTTDIKDFEAEFDDDGFLHIFVDGHTKIKVEFEQIDPSLVTSEDAIGGVGTDGSYKGLELVNHVFPKFRLVPGQILAPRFSTDPAVAAVLKAKAANINGVFKSISLVDIPTDVVTDYTKAAEYKNSNNLTSNDQIVTWPKVSLGGKQYRMSTQAAGVICSTDADNEDIPYVSPSNENLQADSTVLEDGTEITLGLEQANYLNGQGIVTALNFIGGWKLWGNRTGAYPAITAPKDSFIPIRRMFNWISNTLILTYWDKVDDPTNMRLIETVIDSVNIWLNGLSARGFILGGRVEFFREENPVADLIDGIVRFHVYVTPPPPAREINFLLEFDVSYINNLFAA